MQHLIILTILFNINDTLFDEVQPIVCSTTMVLLSASKWRQFVPSSTNPTSLYNSKQNWLQ